MALRHREVLVQRNLEIVAQNLPLLEELCSKRPSEPECLGPQTLAEFTRTPGTLK